MPERTILGPLLFLLQYALMNCEIVCVNSIECMQMACTSLTFAGEDLKHIDDCLNYDLNRMYMYIKCLSANTQTLN